MKFLAGTTFAVLIIFTSLSGAAAAPSATANADPCRSVRKGTELAACKGKQAEAAAAKDTDGAAAPPKHKDPLEQMKIEEEQLSKRLQRICRGC